MILNKYCLFLLILSFQIAVSAQNKDKAKDSLIASEILKKIANGTRVVKLNSNELKLDLTKKDATKIAKIALCSTYGKFHIWKQKPFHVFKIENYWVIWGDFKHEKKRYGGVFEIVINTQNGCIEYLSHSK